MNTQGADDEMCGVKRAGPSKDYIQLHKQASAWEACIAYVTMMRPCATLNVPLRKTS